MTTSAHDVAHEIRKRLPQTGVTQLHKLLYYCQGWSLAFRVQPMFHETIRAYTHGPVVAGLWADERHGRVKHVPVALKDDEISIVAYVTARYGRFSATRLSEMTHQEAPWKEVSEQDSDWTMVDDDIISVERIRDYFVTLDEYTSTAALERENAEAIRPRIADHDRGSTVDDPQHLRRRLEQLRQG